MSLTVLGRKSPCLGYAAIPWLCAQGDLQEKHLGRFWQSLSKCEEEEMGLSDVEDCLASSLQV